MSALPGTVILVLMVLPVTAGLAGVLLPAIGVAPALGAHAASLAPLQALLAHPGLAASAWLSVFTGMLSTGVSLAIVTAIAAGWSATPAFGAIRRVLAPLLSVPHAAAAFGIAFLVAPSGWMMRLASPWATGLDRPPDLLVVGDAAGLALTLGLIAKETPFLFLMTLAALSQVDADRRGQVAASLGYDRVTGWLLAVFPAVYRQIRLPVYVVLAYAMSVVDMAIILGPGRAPPLAVQVMRWMTDPDLTLRTVAAAGALLQLALVIAALAAWRVGEHVVARAGAALIGRGARLPLAAPVRVAGAGAAMIVAALIGGGLVTLGLWSVAGPWPFPDAVPEGATGTAWVRAAPGLIDATGDTALIALVSAGASLLLVIALLEAASRGRQTGGRTLLALIYLPLLVPQIAFLPGLQTLLLVIGADRGLAPVIGAHMIFVLPYVYLSLRDPWAAWNPALGRTAATLGAAPLRVFWQVRLPMLLAPLLTALAVGVAVSVGQYLPTLLVGGGRVQTLTTEAVSLSSGGDRRLIGVYALAQTAAAVLPFWVALTLPVVVWRNRRGVRA